MKNSKKSRKKTNVGAGETRNRENEMAHLVAQGMSKSEVINEALRQYLIEKELAEVRRQLLPYAQSKGIFTDQDIDRLFACRLSLIPKPLKSFESPAKTLSTERDA